jgi:hypothetical protein
MVKPEGLEPLRALLDEIGQDPADNPILPFGRLGGTHFARLLLIEPTAALDGSPLAARLVLMADVDGPLNRFRGRLVDLAGAGLDRLFEHCEGYPPPAARSRLTRLAYLRRGQVGAAAVYVNTIGRTVEQISQEAALRESIQGFLDREYASLSGQSPAEVRQAVQAYVRGQPALRWAGRPGPGSTLFERIGDGLSLVSVPLLLLVLAPLLLIGLPILALLIRWRELHDPAPHLRPDLNRVLQLAALEDHVAHNQFSAIGFVKPERLRVYTARAILFGANWLVRHFFRRADLTGVKTIHFARWVFQDDFRRLLFCSSYDGSLESYMDDFIDKVAWGLNAVFSNGVGYPKTRWLVLDGAKRELEFKDFLRRRQLPTQVWYPAYPQLTALNIENNARIREALWGDLSAEATAEWLRRF